MDGWMDGWMVHRKNIQQAPRELLNNAKNVLKKKKKFDYHVYVMQVLCTSKSTNLPYPKIEDKKNVR